MVPLMTDMDHAPCEHVSYSMSSVITVMLVQRILVEVNSVDHVDVMEWNLSNATAVVLLELYPNHRTMRATFY